MSVQTVGALFSLQGLPEEGEVVACVPCPGSYFILLP